jgi:hypothetical protein
LNLGKRSRTRRRQKRYARPRCSLTRSCMLYSRTLSIDSCPTRYCQTRQRTSVQPNRRARNIQARLTRPSQRCACASFPFVD